VQYREETVTLSGLAGGAVEQRFQEELAKLLRNIDDPNTDSQVKRSLHVELIFHPAKSRQAADLEVKVTSKLAAHKSLETHAFISLDLRNQQLVVREHNPKQAELDLINRQREAAAGAAGDTDQEH
jgi:hypothetical protein